ncbi:MAG TPA: hypothetical protein VD995_08540 [Azospirillum sp.]|nr:hypothetical protein [Azospirillum sp.]
MAGRQRSRAGICGCDTLAGGRDHLRRGSSGVATFHIFAKNFPLFRKALWNAMAVAPECTVTERNIDPELVSTPIHEAHIFSYGIISRHFAKSDDCIRTIEKHGLVNKRPSLNS